MVVVVFPGLADAAGGHCGMLAASLEALGTLDRLGVRPATGVGYGLGEIAGLAWTGCVPAAEAARLLAHYGQVLRACACGPAAMARVGADAEVASALCAPGGLHICAYEGPRTHVLTGPVSGVREMTRRAGLLGVPVEVLDGTVPLHSPAMARCAAPVRSILAGTCFAPPRRRLMSTITGRLITSDDDIVSLLARQVSLPVRFSQAMSQAAEGADLIVTAGPDAGLAAAAAECGGVPAVAIGVRGDASLAEAVAALFAAGAVTDLTPFLAGSGLASDADTLARQTVPQMRVPAVPSGGDADNGKGGRSAVRSGKLSG